MSRRLHAMEETQPQDKESNKMIIVNADEYILNLALKKINQERYEGNVIFNEIKRISKNRIQMTLRVKDSTGPGHFISHQGRRLPSACWHVHGHYFDMVLKFAPNAIIKTMYTKDITKEGGNWMDVRRGYIYFSNMCECNGSNTHPLYRPWLQA
jgi:hypothetical protein